jgi:transcriptional regulator GlxA family with amidase domain
MEIKRIAVYVVLPERTLLLDVAGPLEVLRVANREQAAVRFEVHYVGPAATVLSSAGIMLTDIEPLPAAAGWRDGNAVG